MAPRLPAGPYHVHGYRAAKTTNRLRRFAALPVQRQPQLRPGTNWRGGRTSADEAWVGQIVGTLQTGNDACRHCRAGNGPFTECVTVQDEFGEACANCASQSEQTRCSIRIDHQNAVAVATAQENPPPDVPDMGSPNNFGGTIAAPGPAVGPAAGPVALGGRRPRRVPVITIGPVGWRPGQPLLADWQPPANQQINVGDPNMQAMINNITGLTAAQLTERFEQRTAEMAALGMELAAIRIVQHYQAANEQQ